MNELIEKILDYNLILSDKMVGDRTAFEVLEAAVMGALDEIEEADD